MCGIAGVFDMVGNRWETAPILKQMVAAIDHRGPDGQGFFVEEPVGLGHARLSIIDLTTGEQPMGNADGSLQVTFNGEIFNYLELRKDLEARGHRFRTQSDTETILHQYRESGVACVEAFNGDFAFALWDKQRQRLLLARDRMGVRPLYYTVFQNTLLFASEIKALLRFPGVRAELDPQALDQAFTFWFPIAPKTPFRGIYELPPGHLLVAENRQLSVKSYWKLEFPAAGSYEPLTPTKEEALSEELHDLLMDATRIRLRSDVPVGAYLSGGLDSAVITALIQQIAPSQLRTFSVGFESQEFDETPYQQEMVQALRTEHQNILCTQQDIGQIFPEVIRHTERPVLRTAPAPMFQLSQLVRQSGYKVVLTGEGADEVLGGYDIFKEAKIRRFWSRQPQSQKRPLLLRSLYPYLSGLQRQSTAYLEAFFGVGLDTPNDPFFSHLPRWGMTARIKQMFSADMRQTLGGYSALEELRESLPATYASWHPLSQAQYLETAHLLPGYILSSQGDRMAMAHGVEGRFPFLDHRVVEFSALLPPHRKLKVLTEKYLLRESMRRYLPKIITERPKQPYRAPDGPSFLGENTPDYVEAMLASEAIARTGYFDVASVEKLRQKCHQKTALGIRDSMALVGILSVQLLDSFFVQRLTP